MSFTESKDSTAAAKKRDKKVVLFSDEAILEFKLTANFRELKKDRDEDRAYHPAIVSVLDSAGTGVAMDLKVKVRGNNRRNPAVCDFPPILLNFSARGTRNTVFRGVDKLKLVTHCRSDLYVIREYLIYKLYNILTNHSYQARLCRVTYEDTSTKKVVETKYAFLIEDDEAMAKRNSGNIVHKERLLRMDQTNPQAMALVCFFQYMIGNTDWSVPYRHNIRIVSQQALDPGIPVAYDFDYAGLVSAPYAKPPAELGITSVRQRLFRGYQFEDEIYTEVIKTFNTHKKELYKVYTSCPLLDKTYLKQTLSYLDAFYKTINTPKEFERNIVKVGQQNQKSMVVIKGLK
ncbi:hypothetical protein DC20_20825 [Rufibacter tibetensis]|uniref:Uncharacterized protein n=1 Tax=Rufibacter tibetensis TaxID=512763 RepID=A0A0P0CPF9_9BACT|nr:hypothetical protein DC20_20825 [Rufibacter tibetensis]